jgi:hypothetical protein
VVVVVGALLTLSAWALAATRPGSGPGPNAAGNTVLADDDADAALFQLTGLTPGQAESRCITVSHDGAVPDGIRLIGSAGGSGLYDYLHLTVDAGSGGSFGDCSGFTGAPVFDGSLGDFVRGHHNYDTGLVASAPTQSGSTTFRLRVALDDTAAAQGGTATASFAWEARTADIVVEPVPPTPDPVEDPPVTEPESAPQAEERPATTTRPSEPTRDPDGPPATETTPSPSPPPPPATPPAAPDPGGPAPPAVGGTMTETPAPRPDAKPKRGGTEKPVVSPTSPRPPAPARPAPEDDRGLVETITDAIVPVVQRTAFPLFLLILGGLFLLIQNRIDSRDPKLARAPLHAQPDLPFLPAPSPGDALS